MANVIEKMTVNIYTFVQTFSKQTSIVDVVLIML